MKHILFAFLILGLGFFAACGGNTEGNTDNSTEQSGEMMKEKMNANDAAEMVIDSTGKEYTSVYICPMYCKGSGSDQPGTCPVCDMDYVKNPKNMPAEAEMESHEGHDHDGHDHEGHNH